MTGISNTLPPQAAAEKDRARRGHNERFAAGLLDAAIDVHDCVSMPAGKPARRRYAVYRNNVVVGLMEALQAAYPSLHAIMGSENFTRASHHFLVAHPPVSAMMLCFGEGFETFLEGFAPLRDFPFLADVARLERAWLEAYHAADEEALTGEDLAGLPSDAVMDLVFEPHPAFALVESRFPVMDLFAYRFGQPEPGAIDLSKGQAAMATRPGLSVELTEIGRDQFEFLSELGGGSSLGQAAEKALGIDGDFDLAGALALSLTRGAFRRSRA